MRNAMSEPDKAQAEKILSRVGFFDRFPAGRLRPPVGIIPGAIDGLEELHLLLTPDDRGLPGLNLKALTGWVREKIGDTELATALETNIGSAGSYVDGCLRTHEIVGKRLSQARTTLDKEVIT